MTHIFTENNIDVLYRSIIEHVLKDGAQVNARGLSFKELLFPHIILTHPRARIVENEIRKISKKFLLAEFIWMMSGQDSLDMIGKYNKNISQFSDDGKCLHGAYGPRLRSWRNSIDQLWSCLRRLKDDSGSRQAVMIILDPGIDFTVKTKDVPCNDLLQFFIRDNKLYLGCYVRSNDINWGFPYDLFHWTMLQELFASILGIEVGEYHHMVGSLHIYDRDAELMKNCLESNAVSQKMKKMPPTKDLEILDTLRYWEEQYRVYGKKAQENHLDAYWRALLGLLY